MSAEVRSALALAASSVEGITATPYFVQTTKPGSAYVRLDHVEFPNRFGGVAFWDVVLVLPQDYATAEKFHEAKVPDLIEAIRPHLAVTRVTPQQLAIDGVGLLPTVFISGHREE